MNTKITKNIIQEHFPKGDRSSDRKSPLLSLNYITVILQNNNDKMKIPRASRKQGTKNENQIDIRLLIKWSFKVIKESNSGNKSEFNLYIYSN